MATTPRDRLDRERWKVKALPWLDVCSVDCRDRLLEWASALDDAKTRHKYRNADGDITTFKPRSVEAYLQCLRICVEDGFDLLDATASEFNRLMDHMHDDEGKSKSTLTRYQSAAVTFYRYHDDLDVGPDEITRYTPDSSPKHDETDMFTEDEVDALRAACGASGMPTRNRALLELLVFTGQRISALLTLRVKDVDVEDGYIYLNDDYDSEFGGLKGALHRGRKRPMFGARKYVRDYIEYHRATADPDDWLFIGDPSHWKTNTDDHWAEPTARQVLVRIADEADVDKPVNPHNFRHYCATVLYRDYDLDRDTIRMLLGHTEGSSALEETYSHVFDEDYIERAEIQMGYREKPERRAFTPEACTTCGELLKPDWRQCPNCQEVYGPSDDFEEDLEDARSEATEGGLQSTDPAEIEAVEAILDAVDDPVGLAEQLATLNEK